MNLEKGMSKELHTIPPIFDTKCRVLILGSFPSQKSRECAFFYGNPQNRFWRMLAAGTNSNSVPTDNAGKKRLLLDNRIALWDVIKSCTVTGSSDSSIRDVVPNDIEFILTAAPIEAIVCNGRTAYSCFKKFVRIEKEIDVTVLPSTSPANASWPLERLIEVWGSAMEKYI